MLKKVDQPYKGFLRDYEELTKKKHLMFHVPMYARETGKVASVLIM